METTTTTTTTTISDVIALVKQGLSAKQIGEKLGIKNVNYFLSKNGTSVRDIKPKKQITPQIKAWRTRKQKELIEEYKKTISSGIKANISKQFKKQFGTDLKSILNEVKKPKVKKERVKKVSTTKESFVQKEVELMIPYRLRELIEAQNRRIEALEQIIMQQNKEKSEKSEKIKEGLARSRKKSKQTTNMLKKIEKIKTLHTEGLTNREIARKLGISHSSITKYLGMSI